MGRSQILLTGALFAVKNLFGFPHQKVRVLFIGKLIPITRPKELSTLWRTEPELGIFRSGECYLFNVVASFRILSHPNVSCLF